MSLARSQNPTRACVWSEPKPATTSGRRRHENAHMQIGLMNAWAWREKGLNLAVGDGSGSCWGVVARLRED